MHISITNIDHPVRSCNNVVISQSYYRLGTFDSNSVQWLSKLLSELIFFSVTLLTTGGIFYALLPRNLSIVDTLLYLSIISKLPVSG